MPHEIFGAIGDRLPATAPRNPRRRFLFVSVAVHAVVLTGALFLSLTSPVSLPEPRQVLAFTSERIVHLDDIVLDAPTRPLTAPRMSATTTATAPVSDSAAPVVAAIGVAEETGKESAPAVTITRPDGLSTIERGPGAGLDLAGTGTTPIQPLPAARQQPIRLHSGMKEPVKTVHVAPAYPVLAQNARMQGTVILEAVIGVTGRVESVSVLRSIPLLDGAAVDAVRRWQYTPATLNDAPVPVIMTVTVTFELK
jgi:protein TonB